MPTTYPKVSVLGFRAWKKNMERPSAQVARIEEIIADLRAEEDTSALVKVRSVTYCGPGSAGAAGAAMVEVWTVTRGMRTHRLMTVWRDGSLT